MAGVGTIPIIMFENVPIATHMQRFRYFVYDGEEFDPSSRKYHRHFSGRMTKGRWKTLQRYARRNTWREGCSHEHDCCGCMCSQHVSITYRHNQVVVIVLQYFNY